MTMKFLSVILVAIAMLFLMSMHQHGAARVFDGDRKLMTKEYYLLLGSMKANPAPNPGTLIPASANTKASTINQKNFAGHIQAPPPPCPYFDTMQVLFGKATGRK
ncbi:hypothetical protein FEM48_Zijuj09G0053500 [Ziziphus jujuba var. spinosa]|uniref:Uncharacterized protein n=1 Tax=Ziziphus jujuba var. spinosa TaxID=714518 RepID=A0A978UR44_ZIZJJ|nr:hypothetical protein FEM48_Zijuj09G0053500 [Ziziphus jujuba var. spinosa]